MEGKKIKIITTFVILIVCLSCMIMFFELKSGNNKCFHRKSSNHVLKKEQIYYSGGLVSKVVSKKMPNGDIAYTIFIKNNTFRTLKHVKVYLTYPIVENNSIRYSNNPFKLVANFMNFKHHDEWGRPLIENNDKVVLTVTAPLSTVFLNYKNINLDAPSLEVEGFSLNGSKEIPFQFGKSGV